jgi:TolB-like protein
MRRFLALTALMVMAMAAGRTAARAADAEKHPPAKTDKAPAGLTVAVLDFTTDDPANPNAGGEMASALIALLSGEPGFKLVERQSLLQTLHEHELNLTGLVHAEQAIKIGKLVGAKIMITGRSFRLGKDVFITAKLIGTETSLVEGVMVKDASTADLGALVVELSAKVAAKVRQAGPKLVAAEDAADPLPALKKKLAGRRLPIVAVIVREQHHAAAAPVATARAADPAAETEIKKVLGECGFTVRDVADNELAGFAAGWTANDVGSWPRGLSKVEVLIAGEAFSEFAARIGNIVSCSARTEINVIDRASGKVALADRVTTRAADLSEHIAGKKALQCGGRAMAIRLLEHFADTLPEKKK